jgi:Fumarylacetoacetate (FAA) hydrolase family
MKSRDTFAPIGPYIVTADEIKDPHKLQIRLTNNGVVMQNFNTDDMAHKIPRCIEWITSIHTLHPGDILATGTNHRGLNPFMDGDNIELTCEGCGTLHIAVRDDLKRTWARITRLQHKQSGTEGAHTKQTGGKYAPSQPGVRSSCAHSASSDMASQSLGIWPSLMRPSPNRDRDVRASRLRPRFATAKFRATPQRATTRGHGALREEHCEQSADRLPSARASARKTPS